MVRSCWPRHHASRDRAALRRTIATATRSRSIAARWRCAPGARRHCTRARCRSANGAATFGETARVIADGLVAAGIDKLPSSNPLKQWRGRVMFLRKAELRPCRIPGLICPMTRSRATRDLADACALRQDISQELSAGDLSDALMTLLPWECARGLSAKRRRISRRRPAPNSRSTTTPSRARPLRSACRNCTGSTPIRRLRRARSASAGVIIPGAPAGAGDPRPAGFWRGSYAGGAIRSARPLSQASLAEGSGRHDADRIEAADT